MLKCSFRELAKFNFTKFEPTAHLPIPKLSAFIFSNASDGDASRNLVVRWFFYTFVFGFACVRLRLTVKRTNRPLTEVCEEPVTEGLSTPYCCWPLRRWTRSSSLNVISVFATAITKDIEKREQLYHSFSAAQAYQFNHHDDLEELNYFLEDAQQRTGIIDE